MTKLSKEKRVEDCHPPIIVSDKPRTKEEANEFVGNLIIEHRQQQKQKKLMYLDQLRCKSAERGAFYILALLFLLVGIPSFILDGLTVSNAIGAFFFTFWGSLYFYDGFINKDTTNAWTED